MWLLQLQPPGRQGKEACSRYQRLTVYQRSETHGLLFTGTYDRVRRSLVSGMVSGSGKFDGFQQYLPSERLGAKSLPVRPGSDCLLA